MESLVSSGSPELKKSMQFYAKAKELESARNLQKALLFYQAAIKTCPLNAASYVGLLTMLISAGEYLNAVKVLNTVPREVYDKVSRVRFAHGVVLIELLKYEEAIEVLEQLVGVPDINQGAVFNNLGTCYNRTEQYEPALEYYKRAQSMGFDAPELWVNLATAAKKSGRLAEAQAFFEKGAAKYPDESNFIYEYALFLLARQDYNRGFELYRHRWGAKVFGADEPRMPLPRWMPGVEAKRVMLLFEQGVGDQIVFSALVPFLLARVPEVTLIIDARLHGMLRRKFPEIRCVDFGQVQKASLPGMFDAYVMAGDLGRWAASEIPPDESFLEPDAERVSVLQAKYRALFPGKYVVGISWKSQRPVYGQMKSVNVDEWGPLFALPDVQFVSLQYGDVNEDLVRAKELFGVDIYCDPDIDTYNDLEGVAAQALAVDQVVTTSNTNAHLSAAVGARTWLIAPAGGGLLWYWGHKGELVDWYPSVRAFRPPEAGHWQPVLERVASELRRTIGGENE